MNLQSKDNVNLVSPSQKITDLHKAIARYPSASSLNDKAYLEYKKLNKLVLDRLNQFFNYIESNNLYIERVVNSLDWLRSRLTIIANIDFSPLEPRFQQLMGQIKSRCAELIQDKRAFIIMENISPSVWYDSWKAKFKYSDFQFFESLTGMNDDLEDQSCLTNEETAKIAKFYSTLSYLETGKHLSNTKELTIDKILNELHHVCQIADARYLLSQHHQGIMELNHRVAKFNYNERIILNNPAQKSGNAISFQINDKIETIAEHTYIDVCVLWGQGHLIDSDKKAESIDMDLLFTRLHFLFKVRDEFQSLKNLRRYTAKWIVAVLNKRALDDPNYLHRFLWGMSKQNLHQFHHTLRDDENVNLLSSEELNNLCQEGLNIVSKNKLLQMIRHVVIQKCNEVADSIRLDSLSESQRDKFKLILNEQIEFLLEYVGKEQPKVISHFAKTMRAIFSEMNINPENNELQCLTRRPF